MTEARVQVYKYWRETEPDHHNSRITPVNRLLFSSCDEGTQRLVKVGRWCQTMVAPENRAKCLNGSLTHSIATERRCGTSEVQMNVREKSIMLYTRKDLPITELGGMLRCALFQQ